VQLDVGRAELGVVVVAVSAETVCDAGGLGQVGAGSLPVALGAADHCLDKVHGAQQRERLGCGVVPGSDRCEGVDSACGDVLGLVVVPQADEGVSEPEVACDDGQRLSRLLGRHDRSIGRHPRGIGFVLASERGGRRLVGTRAQRM
jgi:hypothetical protein